MTTTFALFVVHFFIWVVGILSQAMWYGPWLIGI